MVRSCILALLLLAFHPEPSAGQVKIRIFSQRSPETVLFQVTSGKFEILAAGNKPCDIGQGQSISISMYKGKLAVKTRDEIGFVCDSLTLRGTSGDDDFSVRIGGKTPVKRNYSGNLSCYADMGTIVMVNDCDINNYIAGVVLAEGGETARIEYLKAQAVIARTYLYRHFHNHPSEKYDLCDNTHCQVFSGTTSNSLINRAATETRDQVIISSDGNLIASAFHSNCGGETASSEDVWLTGEPYLKHVTDPYCTASRNANWEKRISLNDWIRELRKSGFSVPAGNPGVFDFNQAVRVPNYTAGPVTVPLMTIRKDMKLRSTFFSVVQSGDTVILKGRGYGHGVGLCQEGAMVMAAKGLSYKQIIDFYYTGVMISEIGNTARVTPAITELGTN